MKSVRWSVGALLLLIVAVLINSVYIGEICEELSREVDAAGVDSAEYERIFLKFQKAERIISLSVSHDDLTNIEEGFAEIIGAAKAGGEVGIMTVKSRLTDALLHLRRLSGIKIDSIF